MIKYRSSILVPLLAVLVTASAGTISRADDIAESARKIVEANKDAVVTVEVVVEMKMSYGNESEKRENKSSSTGVVVDPSGLVVTSLASVNPSESSQGMMGDSEAALSTRITDAKIRMADGTEVPVDVVLRDRDLDMIFMKPKKAAGEPLKYIDLTQSASPSLLDPILVLSRLGQVGNRSISANLDRVSTVLSKPRVAYVLSGISGYNLGSPVFTLDGKVAGIAFLRMAPGGDDSASAMDRILPVTLPCSTIMNAAAQAKNARPEKIGEEPKPTVKPTKPAAKPATKPAAKPAK